MVEELEGPEKPDGVTTTRHSKRRIAQRANVPPRAAKRLAKTAMEKGFAPDDPRLPPALIGKVQKSIARTRARGEPNGIFRVHLGLLFIFGSNGALITVLPGYEDFAEGTRGFSAPRKWVCGERSTGPKSRKRPAEGKPHQITYLGAEPDDTDQ